MSLQALIFDFDGLIVDTETSIYHAWREIYQDHGQELDLATYSDCVGSDHQQFDPMQHLDQLLGRRLDWNTLEPIKEARIRQLLEHQQVLPGVCELLSAAAEQDIACAVASSSSLGWVSGWLEKLELDHHFEIVRTRDHVERIKPHPDLFLAATEGLKIQPAHAIVFEDSEHGLRAAQAAGIHCVAVPNQVTSAGVFHGAAMRLNSLAEIDLESLHGLFD